jgi:predicted transcriptional regulator
MRTREAFTISLPPAMSQAVEKARKAERRTRSEIVRDALRLYFNPELALRIARLPVYTPTPRELRELEQGRQEMRRGEFLTLDEFFRHLESPPPKARPRGGRPRSAT